MAGRRDERGLGTAGTVDKVVYGNCSTQSQSTEAEVH
jgi:hypothetical protein